MRKLLSLSLFTLSASAFAANPAPATATTAATSTVNPSQICSVLGKVSNNVFNGATSCGQGSIDTLTVNGPVSLSHTTVKNTLTVTGPVDADHATLNTTDVIGNLNANYVTFNGDVTVSDESTFSYSKLQNLIVNAIDANTTVRIYLEGNSTVKNISVKQGKVFVFLGKHAKITGKAEGAKVMKIKH